ncbi:MAG TPA: hypothetical protein PLS95_18125 [Thermoanaerobaculales bacterium]|nr:hypothetical protein [Thermoanaerobaculales bacterium]HQN94980.1 hypothetical protein [Thermoanaerobaculales bacterium]HQP44859.1 hypothetical protein [Thermoanaerobaculales bacterium]
MMPDSRTSRLAPIVAATVVLLLGGLLAARLLARPPAMVAPTATVPPAAAADLAGLEVPCWSCPEAKEWPIRFRTDLDLLAPPGNGTANAAEWFALFEKERGPRAKEAAAFMDRRIELPALADLGQVVPGDDPLLLEAEPWVDQAAMSFYPEVFPLEGYDTRITNLLVPLTMARSWTARGVAQADAARGLDDCRRAIRLGRLLRQEDVVVINDLVGLACIHIGTRGVYRIAQRTGDTGLALLASVVLGEVAPQRLYTSQRITDVDLAPYLTKLPDGGAALDVPDAVVERITAMATGGADRRFRGEALLGANLVVHYGTAAQQARVRATLDQIAAGGDPDFASFATWSRDTAPSPQLLADVIARLE